MLMQKQCNKIILQEIQNVLEIQQCSMFFIIEKIKETFLNLTQEIMKIFQIISANLFCHQQRMIQYYTVNVKLSVSQLNRLKSTTRIATDITLRLSSYKTGDDESNFPHRLLLTDRQTASILIDKQPVFLRPLKISYHKNYKIIKTLKFSKTKL